ncbi:NAD(P)/FAD-dependent oxidoreductase [Rhodococcus sp. NPDC058521]|uniref:NAD(P)/FAD-dependent oxidoreductase n=1 Tax=Rhodococcus sp. NPDC058521 TaxID=3346536 RepID=UPI003661F415
MTNNKTLDVAIVGGGPAGLNAALVLAQARRSVTVIDAGQPRNELATHLRGFLTRDGTVPTDLLAMGREEAERFGVTFTEGSVTKASAIAGGFELALADGESLVARRLLVATGISDTFPDIEGFADRWAKDVLHCPYCHGYEVRDQPLGVIAETAFFGVHQALMVRQWTDDVVLFTHTDDAIEPGDREKLDARDIRIVSGKVTGLEVENDELTGVRLADGTVTPRRAVFVGGAITPVPRDQTLRDLGAETNDTPFGPFAAVDATGATSVPGVWAAGNVVDPKAQVVISASAGYQAAVAINMDLIEADVEAAVAARRAR